MSLLDLQRSLAEALHSANPPEPLRFSRDVVRAKRRKELHEKHPRIPAGVVDAFVESGEADLLSFAESRVDGPTSDFLRYDRLVKSLGSAAAFETFSIDLRAAERGKVVPDVPRRWLLARGVRPIRLWRTRAPLTGGG